MMGMVMCVMVECCGTRNSYKACVIGFSNNMYLLNYCDGGGDFYSVTLAFRQTTGNKADGDGLVTVMSWPRDDDGNFY
jgi:hypothetical protein